MLAHGVAAEQTAAETYWLLRTLKALARAGRYQESRGPPGESW